MLFRSKRENLINKLNGLRTNYENEEKNAASHLISVEKEIGQKITSIHQKGNCEQCFAVTSSEREQYCANRIKDPQALTNCRNKSHFCYICCQNEFPLSNDELNSCLNKCDTMPSDGNNFQSVKVGPTYVVNSSTAMGIIN